MHFVSKLSLGVLPTEIIELFASFYSLGNGPKSEKYGVFEDRVTLGPNYMWKGPAVINKC